MAFRSKFPRGDLRTPARASENSFRPAAATSLEEKFADAGSGPCADRRHAAACLHVLWDLPGGTADAAKVRRWRSDMASGRSPSTRISFRIRNTSLARSAIRTLRSGAWRSTICVESVASRGIEIARDVSLWIADGSNYPGIAEHPQAHRVARGSDWPQRTRSWRTGSEC